MTRTTRFLMTLALAALVQATDAYGQDATAKQFIGTWRLVSPPCSTFVMLWWQGSATT